LEKAETSGPVHVNGIVRLGGHCGGILTAFSDAKPGTTYQAIAQMPQISGVIEELCSENWQEVFENLSKQLTTRKKIAKNRFVLPVTVASANEISVYVDGRSISYGQDWMLDTASNSVGLNLDTKNSTTLEVRSQPSQ
jgi:hypothetical protein